MYIPTVLKHFVVPLKGGGEGGGGAIRPLVSVRLTKTVFTVYVFFTITFTG